MHLDAVTKYVQSESESKIPFYFLCKLNLGPPIKCILCKVQIAF